MTAPLTPDPDRILDRLGFPPAPVVPDLLVTEPGRARCGCGWFFDVLDLPPSDVATAFACPCCGRRVEVMGRPGEVV